MTVALKDAATLRRIAARVLAGLDELADGLNSGALSPVDWHNAVADLLLVGHTAAYMEGRGQDALSPGARRLVAQAVGGQVEYLNGFLDTVEREGWQDGPMRARLALYVQPLATTYSRGQTFGLDVPFQPKERTACRMNCKCAWRVRWLDEEELNADLTWVLSSAEHCETCRARARLNPYQFRGGRWVNRPASTRGLTA